MSDMVKRDNRYIKPWVSCILGNRKKGKQEALLNLIVKEDTPSTWIILVLQGAPRRRTSAGPGGRVHEICMDFSYKIDRRTGGGQNAGASSAELWQPTEFHIQPRGGVHSRWVQGVLRGSNMSGLPRGLREVMDKSRGLTTSSRKSSGDWVLPTYLKKLQKRLTQIIF